MKPGRLFFSLFLFILGCQTVVGQTPQPLGTVLGTVTDDKGQALIGVNLVLTSPDTTEQKHYTVTDVNGVFLFSKVPQRAYQLKASYVGFDDLTRTVNLLQDSLQLGKLQLLETARQLKEVQVVAKAPTAQQKAPAC